VKSIVEEIKDLNELKQTVIALKKNVEDLSGNIKEITSKKAKKNDIIEDEQIDFDLNKDGKISPIEIMLVKLIQKISEKQQETSVKNQHTGLYMLIATLLFLALQVILAAFGMQVSF
jgi:ABC-type uncharacterized transport system ATPase subunit